MMTRKSHCRTSVLAIALFVSLTGIALAESSHKTSTCHANPECFFTVVESFCKALASSATNIQFNVGP